MREERLGLAMLGFERKQAAMKLRPPLPCDGKLIVQRYKCFDRTEEVYWLIKRNHGLTTAELFDLVHFAHGDFTYSLQTLVERGRVTAVDLGRAKTYYPAPRTS